MLKYRPMHVRWRAGLDGKVVSPSKVQEEEQHVKKSPVHPEKKSGSEALGKLKEIKARAH